VKRSMFCMLIRFSICLAAFSWLGCAHQRPENKSFRLSQDHFVTVPTDTRKAGSVPLRSSGEAYAAVLKAEISLLEGHRVSAVHDFKEAMVHHNDTSYLKQRLAEVLWDMGDSDGALKWNEAAITVEAKPAYLCWKAWVKAQTGKGIEAKKLIKDLNLDTLAQQTCVFHALSVISAEPLDMDENEAFLKHVLIPKMGVGRASFLMAEILLERGASALGEKYLVQSYNADPVARRTLGLMWRYAFSNLKDADADRVAGEIYVQEPSTHNAHRWLLTLLLNEQTQKAQELGPSLFDKDNASHDGALWWPWLKTDRLDDAKTLWQLKVLPAHVAKQVFAQRVARNPALASLDRLCSEKDHFDWDERCLNRLVQEKKYTRAQALLLSHLKRNKLSGQMLRLWVHMAKGPSSNVTSREIKRVLHLLDLEQKEDVDIFIAQLEATAIFEGSEAAFDTLDHMIEGGKILPSWASVLWLLEQEEPLRALEVLETNFKLNDETDAYSLNLWAFTLAESRTRLSEALVAGHKALLLDPLNPAVLDTLGWVYFQSGQMKVSQRYFERAHALSPMEIEIAWHLALVYVELGHSERALATIKRIENVFTLSERLKRHIRQLRQKLELEVGQGA
jgi:tetratricopeptide (TPR) repeat protein